MKPTRWIDLNPMGAPEGLPSGTVEATYTSPTGALRNNVGKVPYGYLPLDLLDGAAQVMAFGATKYKDAENYRKGFPVLETLHSLMRHTTDLQRALATGDKTGDLGHLKDTQSKLGHIHHVITSALIMLDSMRLEGYDV